MCARWSQSQSCRWEKANENMFTYYENLRNAFQKLGVTDEEEDSMKEEIEDVWENQMRHPDPDSPILAWGLSLESVLKFII